MLVSQLMGEVEGQIIVVARQPGETARIIRGAESVYHLALAAADGVLRLEEVLQRYELGEEVDLLQAAAQSRFLPPISHPDPCRLYITGTGLTHLGSATARDSMHVGAAAPEGLTDSMKMFQMGLEGGRPKSGEMGVQPEWFYKGNGTQVVRPGGDLQSPSFALDGGEEPELAGIYVIAKTGEPCRVGFALSNEFSDHVTERMNYLYLAHSKLRPASFGPEIRLGPPPRNVRGTSRIWRDDVILFEKQFLSGEDNMSHTFANLEYHHFKYDLFRQPGDVHVHMFGTATLSFADDVKTQRGDIFEIEAPDFGVALRNTLSTASNQRIAIRQI